MGLRELVEEYRALSGFDAVEVELNEQGWVVRARIGSRGVAMDAMPYDDLDDALTTAIAEARALAEPRR